MNVKALRERYPSGSRIRLSNMNDPYAPVEAGTTGTVDYIDDIGQIHVQWDNGRTLPLVPGEDSFTIIESEPVRASQGQMVAAGLPELCFTVLPTDGSLICIKRGEMGYFPSDWGTTDRDKNRELADFNNRKLGVTKAQEEAMRTGSMVGWDVPGADPAWVEAHMTPQRPQEPQMGGLT